MNNDQLFFCFMAGMSFGAMCGQTKFKDFVILLLIGLAMIGAMLVVGE